jgi:glycosyltransferase 2 family protein
VSAAKSAAAIVPNALGVQEATYAALAPLFGVGAPFGLAVSLIKRARDLALGVPILALSHALEGRKARVR